MYTPTELAQIAANERDTVPARKTDPDTSKAARPLPMREQVYNFIKDHGPRGATADDLAYNFGSHRMNSITPRFAELRKAGRIKDSGQRRDGQIVWVLA